MRIFIDTADLEEIKKYNDIGIVDGVTTNPTLVAREGRDFKTLIKEIAKIVDGPISAEVISLESDGMIKEARELAKIHPNIVIKIPMTGSGLKAVKVLSKEGIRTNVTLVFSSNQALLAAKAGATYVSVFVGRLDDQGHDGMQVIEETVAILDNYDFQTELIVASVRHPIHVIQSGIIGADIVTLPPKVIGLMLKHPKTDLGIEQFLADWKTLDKK
ncbi:MAG: fructose-6-phosphate aldolase [Candidatus Ranarchaeia archaeon]